MGNEKVDLVNVAKPVNKKSLLQRYDIPIEHLSYEYINESTDAKKLERIILILRSGEEGFYPDLTKCAEERLAVIKPESTVLRVPDPVITKDMLAPEKRKKLENDMNEWMNEMKLREKDLEEGRAMQIKKPIPQPDVREIKFNEQTKKQKSSRNQNYGKRISSCDYAAWDRYDADTELNRIDLQHEKKQAEVKRTQKELRAKEEKVKKSSREAVVNKLTLTGTEFNVMAEEERKKGNEAFKAGDYEEALQFYNLSISIDATTQAYNNRAITYIKLQRYNDAIKDCNNVISTEHMNIKALLRRGLALEHLEKRAQALADYEAVLKLEPTNKVAIIAINKLRGPCNSKKIQMKIEEVSATEEASVTKASVVERNGNGNHAKSKPAQEKLKQVFSADQAFKTSHKPTTLSRCNPISSKQTSHLIHPQVCFCNNAPSSSQHTSPLPHMKDIYCSKTLDKSVKLTKLQSIFTDTKMFSEKSSGVIIEEIPNEPYEKPMERSCAKRSDDKSKKSPERNTKLTTLGSGDTLNDTAKKSGILIEELPTKKVDRKEEIIKDKKIDVTSTSCTKKRDDKLKKSEERYTNTTTLGSGDTPDDISKKSVSSIEELSMKKVDCKEEIVEDKKFDETSTSCSKRSVDKLKKSEGRNTKLTTLKSGDTPDDIDKKAVNSIEELPMKKVDRKEKVIEDKKFDETSTSCSKRSDDKSKKSQERKTKLTTLASGDTRDDIDKKAVNSIEELPIKKVDPKEEIIEDKKFDETSTSCSKRSDDKSKKSQERKTKLTTLASGDTRDDIDKKAVNSIEEFPIKKVDRKEEIIEDKKFDETSTSCSKRSDDKSKKSQERNTKLTILASGDTPDDITEKPGNSIEQLPTEKFDCKEEIIEDTKFNKPSTPYEFIKMWHSLKNDSDLIMRTRLLQSFTPEYIDTGNKLDGDMLSIILRCFERHFCNPEYSTQLHRFLQSLTNVKRFSLICMFMDKNDKKVLHNVFLFLEAQGSAPDRIQDLRKAYGILM